MSVLLTATLEALVRTRIAAPGDSAENPLVVDADGALVRILTAAAGAVVLLDADAVGTLVRMTTCAAGGVNAEPVDSVAGGEAWMRTAALGDVAETFVLAVACGAEVRIRIAALGEVALALVPPVGVGGTMICDDPVPLAPERGTG